MSKYKLIFIICLAAIASPDAAPGQNKISGDASGDASRDAELTFKQAVAKMKPFTGKTKKGVDTSTLYGKVMCGYQGWYSAKGDGSGWDWTHYNKNGAFQPGKCVIDMWPDMTEMDEDEKYPTPFKHKNGQTAYVFSSYNKKTVIRHFKWMKDYSIDGAFIQRFGVEIMPHTPVNFNHFTTVLAHCREGANLHGRAYAIMYDLSGLKKGEIRHIINDWKLLKDRMHITDDKAYLHHKGKPVIAVWGVGFSDKRDYTLSECEALVDFFKNDKEYGNNTVMLGLPMSWRTQGEDCTKDKRIHRIIKKSDIVMPWSVSRFEYPEYMDFHAKWIWKLDMDWCKKHNKDYLPVVFPGFSWHNMMKGSKFNSIPRQKGRFQWKQYVAAKNAGAKMIYQAMFDEMDEGTAIFKCSSDPPTGKSRFLTYEGLPDDYYLWLAGQGGLLLKGDLKLSGPSYKKLPDLIPFSYVPFKGDRKKWKKERWPVCQYLKHAPDIDGNLHDWP